MFDPRIVSPAYELQRYQESERRAAASARRAGPHTRWSDRDAGDRLGGRSRSADTRR